MSAKITITGTPEKLQKLLALIVAEMENPPVDYGISIATSGLDALPEFLRTLPLTRIPERV